MAFIDCLLLSASLGVLGPTTFSLCLGRAAKLTDSWLTPKCPRPVSRQLLLLRLPTLLELTSMMRSRILRPLVTRRWARSGAAGRSQTIRPKVRCDFCSGAAPGATPLLDLTSRIPLTTLCLILATDRSVWLANVSEQLKKLAIRQLAISREHTDCNIMPLEPPALLSSLTDELLVLASDVVKAEAARCTVKNGLGPISGKAQLRLLAWVVADARGAVTRLEKDLAETVGKRLDRQAQKVRADMTAASEFAERQRAYVNEELAKGDRDLAATKLAEIDEAEQLKLGKPRSEVYVGFHELESLLVLPRPEPAAAPAAPAAPEPAPASAEPGLPPVLASALQAADAPRPPSPEPPPIPLDLARQLGRDGVQALWDFRRGTVLSELIIRSDDWWKLLPHLVRMTLIERSRAYDEGRRDALDMSDNELAQIASLRELISERNSTIIELLKEQLEQKRVYVVQLEAAAKAAGVALPEPPVCGKRKHASEADE